MAPHAYSFEFRIIRGTYPEDLVFSTSLTVSPKRKKFSAPISSLISTLAPSSVPIVRAPFN